MSLMQTIRAREKLELIQCFGAAYLEQEPRRALLMNLVDQAFGDDETAHAEAVEVVSRRS